MAEVVSKTTNICYSFNVNLTVGSQGPDVVALNNFLVAKGFATAGTLDGSNFTESTANAVKKYQSTIDIPATGFVGPLTRAHLNGDCAQTGSTDNLNVDLMPKTIGNYGVYGLVELSKEECYTDPKEGQFCYKYLRAQYRETGGNRIVFVNLTVYTKGYDVWKKLITPLIIADKISGYDVFRVEKHEIAWYPISNSIINVVFTQEGKYTKVTDGENYSYEDKATGDNPVTKYFLSKYSPTGISTPVPVEKPVVNAKLLSTNDDKASIWGVFAPGKGRASRTDKDFNWEVSIKSKTNVGVKSMTVFSNNYEAWSTAGALTYGRYPYPLVVLRDGKQLNNNYDQFLGTTTQDVSTYNLYGQIELAGTFTGKLVTVFTDGTSIETVITKDEVPTVVVPQITISSPNGGEEFKWKESNIIVNWSMNYNSDSLKLYLYNPYVGEVYELKVRGAANKINTAIIPKSAIPSVGLYKINICDPERSSNVGKSLCDISDDYFTVVSPGPIPKVKVLYPNGGNVLFVDKEIDISFTPITGAPHFITLYSEAKNTEWNLVDGNRPIGESTDKQGIKVDLSKVSNSIKPGSGYKIKVCSTTGCDESDSYFTLSSSPIIIPIQNKAPKITDYKVTKTIVSVGQDVNFIATATDPDNDDLYWSIDWGNGGISDSCSLTQHSQSGKHKDFNISHKWDKVGMYKVTVTVNDCRGGNDSQTFNIGVRDMGIASVKVNSPNGGEEYKIGTTDTNGDWVPMKANINNVGKGSYYVYLTNRNDSSWREGYFRPQGGASGFDGSITDHYIDMRTQLNSTVPVGKYYVLVEWTDNSGNITYDFSDQPFSIIKSSVSPVPVSEIISGFCIYKSKMDPTYAVDIGAGKVRLDGKEYNVAISEGMYGSGTMDLVVKQFGSLAAVNGVVKARAIDLKIGTVKWGEDGKVSEIIPTTKNTCSAE